MQSNALDATGFNKVTLFLLGGAISGTPTLAAAIEISDDGTNWYPLNTLSQELSASAVRTQTAFANVTTANAKEALRLGGIFPIPRFIRVNCTISGGTPSITFAVNYVLS